MYGWAKTNIFKYSEFYWLLNNYWSWKNIETFQFEINSIISSNYQWSISASLSIMWFVTVQVWIFGIRPHLVVKQPLPHQLRFLEFVPAFLRPATHCRPALPQRLWRAEGKTRERESYSLKDFPHTFMASGRVKCLLSSKFLAALHPMNAQHYQQELSVHPWKKLKTTWFDYLCTLVRRNLL